MGDDQVLRQPSLETQLRNPQTPGTGRSRSYQRRCNRTAGLAPGDTTLPAVIPCGARRRHGTSSRRVFSYGQEELRHEVLEHGAAPGDKADVPGVTGEEAAEREPVFLRYLAVGYQQEAGEPGLGGQQVVPAWVSPPLAQVVADAQQVPDGIVEEIELNARQFPAAGRQLIDECEPSLRGVGGTPAYACPDVRA